MAGLFYEDFVIGQCIEHELRRTVTEMDNMLFCNLTLNPQPLHIDFEYAASTEFGKPLVNSLFTLGLMIGISVYETTLRTTIANLGMREVQFPKPVFHGDTLRVRSIAQSKRDSASRPDAGLVEFRHEAINQKGEIVAICIRTALMKRNPAGTARP